MRGFRRELFTRYLAEEARFIAAVKLGEAALQRGEYLTHEQVGERLDHLLSQVAESERELEIGWQR